MAHGPKMAGARDVAALLLLLGSTTEAQVVSIPGLGSVGGSTVAGVAMFKGIPYAEPPVGRLRWQPPVAHKPWSSTLDATDFGAQCLQPSSAQNPSAYNESCLFLNVYAPAAKPAKPLPVMLWSEPAHLLSRAERAS